MQQRQGQEKDPADVSARLDESELLKPGTDIKPGQQAPGIPPVAASAAQSHLDSDIKEFNNFASSLEQQTAEPETKKGILHIVWEIAKTLIIAAVVVIFINTFIFQAYYVDGSSMNPDFINGDYLLVDKTKTSLKNITSFFGDKSNMQFTRGDVLVFRPPENMQIFYIKRVVGLPGERVTLKDGVLKIYNEKHPEGFVVDESYIDQNTKMEGEVDTVVLPGNLFVVGDNRKPGGSYDSRFWGQLPQKNVIGTAFFRVIPLNDAGFLNLPKYDSAQ